ncbi:MAG TPA: beta-ketoacyl-ACP synthase III [Gemmatimonadales bacterium]|jgi:3-oxoacyl-[acyl-carrier-protein] synthase-3|nr:beta-ketoacyl-ACP synthase III [Gemmatimonadales bacterium]
MSKKPIARISGLGVAVPEGVVTNHDFEKVLETSDQWIVERTGIKERHWSGPEMTLAELSRQAAVKAMAQAGIGPMDLGAIILATATQDRLLPSTACDLQALLGAKNAAAYDLSAACSGWLFGITQAEGLIASGQAEHVLVIGAELLSRIIDKTDRTTAILFGDGAGATVISRATDDRGLLSTFIRSDGTLAELLWRPAGGARIPISQQVVDDKNHYIKMAGREVFKSAVLTMAEACDEALKRAGVTADQIDLLVPHQANIRIIQATADHAGIPMEKVMVNVDKYGNTSSASIPLALADAVAQGRVKPGDLLLLVAFGAGFTWGSTVVRW